MRDKIAQELNDDDLNAVTGGAIPSGKGKAKVRVIGVPAEGNQGKGYMFACQNPSCGKAFMISDLNADEYECPYCHKVHISCG